MTMGGGGGERFDVGCNVAGESFGESDTVGSTLFASSFIGVFTCASSTGPAVGLRPSRTARAMSEAFHFA